MADPVTAGMIMVGVGAATGAVGSIYEGNAANAAAQYNAQLAEQNAEQARSQAQEEARRSKVISRKHMGDMKASRGASGVTLDASAMDVLEESAAMAELDYLTIKHGGDVKAQGFRNEARLERFRGKTAKRAGKMRAAGDLMSGGGQMAGMGG